MVNKQNIGSKFDSRSILDFNDLNSVIETIRLPVKLYTKIVGNNPIKVVRINICFFIFTEDKNKFCIDRGMNNNSLIRIKTKRE